MKSALLATVCLSNAALALAAPIRDQAVDTSAASTSNALFGGDKNQEIVPTLTIAKATAEDQSSSLSDREKHVGVKSSFDFNQSAKLDRRMIFGGSDVDGTLFDMIRGVGRSVNHAQLSPVLDQFTSQAAQATVTSHEALNALTTPSSTRGFPAQDELSSLVFARANARTPAVSHTFATRPSASSTSPPAAAPQNIPDPSTYDLLTDKGRNAYKKDRGIASVKRDKVFRKERDRQHALKDPSFLQKIRARHKENSMRRKGLDVHGNPLPELDIAPPRAEGATADGHQYAVGRSVSHAQFSPTLSHFDAQSAGDSIVHHEGFNAPALLVSEHDVPTQDELFDLVLGKANEDPRLAASSSSSTVVLQKPPHPSTYRLTSIEGTKAYKKDRGIRSVRGDNEYRREFNRQLKLEDPSVKEARRAMNKKWRLKEQGLDINGKPLPPQT